MSDVIALGSKISSTLHSGTAAGDQAGAAAPRTADQAEFRSMLDPSKIIAQSEPSAGAIAPASAAPQAGPQQSMMDWLQHSRQDFMHSIDHISTLIKPESMNDPLSVHALMSVQFEMMKLSVQHDFVSRVGSKTMQNFEQLFKNQS